MFESFDSSVVNTSQFGMLPIHLGLSKRDGKPYLEHLPFNTIALRRDFDNVDIDEYRARRGKEEGEAQFFHDNKETGRLIKRFNLLTFNGAAALWQWSLGLGTITANTSFGTGANTSLTLLTNSNAYLYVSDGGISISGQTITGGCSITAGSASLTSNNSNPSNLVAGNYITIQGDNSSGVYLVVSGTGTLWTISPVYGSSINAPTATPFFYIPPSSHNLTAMQGSAGSNVANQVADATYPSNPCVANVYAITGATNPASPAPIVLTVSGNTDINQNDICHVVEVLGNLGANGVFVAGTTNTTTITLGGSTGTGSYTSGTGLVTKKSVLTMQSTFGTSSAVFQWNTWALFNGNGSSKVMINNKLIGLGTKSGSTSSSLKIGLAIG